MCREGNGKTLLITQLLKTLTNSGMPGNSAYQIAQPPWFRVYDLQHATLSQGGGLLFALLVTILNSSNCHRPVV